MFKGGILLKAHIIYEKYYDFDTRQIVSGGIQTYLSKLIPIIKSFGFSCCVYQAGLYNNETVIEGTEIRSISVNYDKNWEHNSKIILKEVEKKYDNNTDFLLFATDCLTVKNKASRSIAIQHGICWDIPCHENFSSKLNNFYIYRKAKIAYRVASNLSKVKNVICVDYNFLNWYRAISAYSAISLTVIPNFTEIAPIYNKPKDKIKIIFARRFEIYRGTRIFTQAISKILDKYVNIEVMIAGRGPDENYIKDHLHKYGKRVVFTQYKSSESIDVHSDKHIAVIPTIGSEGTSLSLLEAMSAQCAVVCTNVGGMTNIVIDGYNGLMISPQVNELYEAIAKLVDNAELRSQLAMRGYETVKYGFSFEVWKLRWEQIIKKMIRS
jgi:glycosyltransferase involved in cell wall biosynthesis